MSEARQDADANRPQRCELLIDGEFCASHSGTTFSCTNPHDGKTIAVVAEADEHDVARAVAAARRAFDEGPWPRASPVLRTTLLELVADEVEERTEELAALETLDAGLPIVGTASLGEVVAEVFRYWAGMATKIEGRTVPALRPGEYLGYTRREPLGVVACIMPWNAPLLTVAWKVAPALACGNTVVIKPAEQTPLTTFELVRILQEVGCPAGVVNLLFGFGPKTGAALVRHRGVDKVAFTGGVDTGKEIVHASAQDFKRLTLELGGKSPHIVFDDVEIESAVSNALVGVFLNSGQVCNAGTRIFVQERIFDAFVGQFLARAKAIRVGDPRDPATRMGPLISREHRAKVESYVRLGIEEGASLRIGGSPPSDPALEDGFYFLPTVFTDVANQMRIAQEEIFGPVAAIIPFADEGQVVEAANDSAFGLAAGIQTNDLKRAHRVAARLRAGTVWVNTWHMIEASAPFGGYKGSGYGRENGMTMVEHLTQQKTVWVDLNQETPDFFAEAADDADDS